VGLVAHELEARGLSTLTLSCMPDLTGSVGISRLVGIEYPHGRTLGQPGDPKGQLDVLRATFSALEAMDQPGSVHHLPFRWPEPRAKAISHPPVPPPISTYLKTHPWHIPNLVSRTVPK
jgi:hypothetical protein